MLLEIVNELRTQLAAQSVPLVVELGPDRGDVRRFGRVVFERDRTANDLTVGSSVGTTPASIQVSVRQIAYVATIHAQSNKAGATVTDHERLADKYADKLEIALLRTMSELELMWFVKSWHMARFDEISETTGSEVYNAATYVMRFWVNRSVMDTAWDDEHLAEVAIGDDIDVRCTTVVTIPANPNDPEPVGGT